CAHGAAIAAGRQLNDEKKLRSSLEQLVSGDGPMRHTLVRSAPVTAYASRLRVRAAKAYADGALCRRGAPLLAPYSDDPRNTGLVEAVNPFFGIPAAVTRQDQKGWPAGGWYPSQKLTLAEGIRGFTLDAAYAAFEEPTRGTIEPGKLADLTIVDGDLYNMPPS